MGMIILELTKYSIYDQLFIWYLFQRTSSILSTLITEIGYSDDTSLGKTVFILFCKIVYNVKFCGARKFSKRLSKE